MILRYAGPRIPCWGNVGFNVYPVKLGGVGIVGETHLANPLESGPFSNAKNFTAAKAETKDSASLLLKV